MSGTADAGPRPGRGPRVWVLALGVAALAAGLLLTVAGPTLYRAGLVDLQGARVGVQEAALWALLGAAALGAAGLLLAVMGRRHRAGIVGVLLMIAGGMPAGMLYSQKVSLAALPPINDVQTDWSLPVAFTEATLKQRSAAGAVRIRDDASVGEGHGKWTGMSYAQAQDAVYKDLTPLHLKHPPDKVVLAAVKAAERLGWEVTFSDPQAGVMEAVYHSPWYDLASDIAMRAMREGEGTRVDVRSTSRTADHDLGENAAQVKHLIDDLALMLR